MKITAVEPISLSYKPKEPMWDGTHYVAQRDSLILRIHTDEGIVGLSEAAYYGGPTSSTRAVIEKELAPLYIGRDPFEVERLWDEAYNDTMPHGRRGLVIAGLSALDVGCWDIIGKACNQPLFRLFGAYTDRVMAYASCGFYRQGMTIETVGEDMQRAVDRGFRAAKMKIGRLRMADDARRIRLAREVLGDDRLLLIDANNAYDVKDAMRMAKHAEESDVFFFEEPVPTDNIQGCAALARSTSVRIAGFETAFTRFEFRDMLMQGALDVVQADSTWAGGYTEVRRIAALAAAWGVLFVPHSITSALCVAINLHMIGSVPNGKLVELDATPNPLVSELLLEPLRFEEGYLKIPTAPGIGVELNPGIVDRYRIDE